MNFRLQFLSILIILNAFQPVHAILAESLLLQQGQDRLGKTLEKNMENLTETVFERIEEKVHEETSEEIADEGNSSSTTDFSEE